MKNKRRIVGNTLLITGLALLLGAGGLYFYNMTESNAQAEEAAGVMDRIRTEVSARTSDGTDAVDPRTSGTVTELVPVLIDGAPYDGYLTIPAIDLEMGVYDTWNDSYLRKSVCRYYGSPYTDDFVIAGHNYRSGFGRLKKLEPGDEVYFTDMSGLVIPYVVKQIDVIDGTDISGMLSGGWDLSLYTCTYGGEARLTVRCERVKL
ncbi:sortase A [Ruminococcaceae bacterium YRB3002]|nr:sortase A [Ruminococcaceae bacterium YRB3002]